MTCICCDGNLQLQSLAVARVAPQAAGVLHNLVVCQDHRLQCRTWAVMQPVLPCATICLTIRWWLQVVGLTNGYHGDTLGVMDAVAPSPYVGPEQMPW